MQYPMILTGRFVRIPRFRVVAETPQTDKAYAGWLITEPASDTSKIEREEGHTLGDNEVLDRSDNLALSSKFRIL